MFGSRSPHLKKKRLAKNIINTKIIIKTRLGWTESKKKRIGGIKSQMPKFPICFELLMNSYNLRIYYAAEILIDILKGEQEVTL